jgi:hypothetical protein
LKKFFVTIFIFFIYSTNCLSSDDIYYIENNEIYLENNGNVLELRENAKILSFENSFKILAKNILDPDDLKKFEQILDYDITALVKDYKIESEKISDINYFAKISVNFNPSKVKDFFVENGIRLNIFISESYLIFPLYKKFNTLFLWDKDNFWYDSLLSEYDQQSLLKLYFPKKNHINKLRISPNNLVEKNSKKISDFLKIYKKKKAIIIFLEENFDIKENNFKIKLSISVFNNGNFSSINLTNKDSLPDNSNLSQVDLIAKLVIKDLQNWWKNKIDYESASDEKLRTYIINVNNRNIKNSIIIEEILSTIIGKGNLRIKELKTNNTTYEIITNYTIKQINLGLESKNLKLIKIDMEKNKFSIENY